MTYYNQDQNPIKRKYVKKPVKDPNVEYFSSSERAKQKQLSRDVDEELMRTGKVSPQEMQLINGGHGLFRNSKVVRKPKNVVDKD